MVTSDQKKAAVLPQAPAMEPVVIDKDSMPASWVSMKGVLDRNKRIATRREKLLNRLSALELRMDVLLDEVQRVKERYNVE